jgi:hypothetical protein
MDPNLLVDSTMPSIPAPWWFVQFFKALGFTLHAVPMNLWYAGLLVALWLHSFGSADGRRFSARLLQQMPIIVAFGVNLGIVPLLFVQLAYYKAFYPATILMAWFWMAIIGLLIPAYYAVYAYAWGLRCGEKGLAAWRVVAGWCAAIFFVGIGFLFANGLSLMDHVGRWPEMWRTTSASGATLGTALNVGDATLWPRWLLMFGLALGTTAIWIVVDAHFLMGPTTNEGYQRWAIGAARKLYTVGMVWAAAAGAWYVFGTWSDAVQNKMLHGPLLALTIATAVVPGLPWLLLMTANWCDDKRATVAAAAVCQLGVLGVNAASRQIVQNFNLRLFDLDVVAQAESVQWSPLLLFLVVFVLGLAVIGWMIVQVATLPRKA